MSVARPIKSEQMTNIKLWINATVEPVFPCSIKYVVVKTLIEKQQPNQKAQLANLGNLPKLG